MLCVDCVDCGWDRTARPPAGCMLGGGLATAAYTIRRELVSSSSRRPARARPPPRPRKQRPMSPCGATLRPAIRMSGEAPPISEGEVIIPLKTQRLALTSALLLLTLSPPTTSAANPSQSCEAALVRYCDLERFASCTACMECVDIHQSDLKQGGCSPDVDFTNFCMITYLPACSPTSSAHPLLSGPTGGLLQLSPPKDSSDAGIAAWLAEMRGWREQCTAQLGYMSGTVGPSQPDLEWTATSYITVQSHPYRLRKQVFRPESCDMIGRPALWGLSVRNYGAEQVRQVPVPLRAGRARAQPYSRTLPRRPPPSVRGHRLGPNLEHL
eukprot:COSAG01_NODE_521_length_15963_cov_76.378530_11_plen_326_part_00